MILNIFGNNHKKNALISYITTPFIKAHGFHTNHQESILIAQIFDYLGYNVYVVDYHTQEKIDYTGFSVVFGFGYPFENSFEKSDILRIYYATGAHTWFQNIAEINRVRSVNNRYNSNIQPKRLVANTWSKSTSLSDAIIVLGNAWTASTYRPYNDKSIYCLNTTFLAASDADRPVPQKPSGNFLWFGSAGLIHKGLDLCLESFSLRPNMKLHICGQMEDDFYNVFLDHFKQPNISFYGFVDVKSDLYANLVNQCMFSILPTCSEGQATSLITNMASGLIPITTKYSGFNVEEHGFLISELTVEAVNGAIDAAMMIDETSLYQRAQELKNYIHNAHSKEAYLSNIHNILKQIGV
jgi:glycosyltransferase involved in cell wall biosynthesis